MKATAKISSKELEISMEETLREDRDRSFTSPRVSTQPLGTTRGPEELPAGRTDSHHGIPPVAEPRSSHPGVDDHGNSRLP